MPPGLSNVVQIAAGAVHSLGLVDAGPSVMRAPLINPLFGTNGFTVSLQGRSGHVYVLLYKDHLSEPAWTSLPLIAGAPWAIQLQDPTAPKTQRFYRVSKW
ncbi:MAG TPA: hypothetical protein VL361_18885 [Candidatus Limnocylindrales bacterium]|nr:hypothetical protein [Candidatus Limnocylindrales bacterium]